MTTRQFNTDCEGPISKNDNAQELADYFLPEGVEFFARVSKYDDYLADVVEKPGYKAGDTLKLILPFLRAYGATTQAIEEYSAAHILLIPGSKEAMQHICATMPSFIISTSYKPYIRALCEVIGFPIENTYCTELDIDRYDLTRPEVEVLKQLRGEIVEMPMIDLEEVTAPNQLSSESRRVAERMDEIFWRALPAWETCSRMLSEVNPVGGQEKAKAVQDSLRKTRNQIQDTTYIGDSITDVQAFDLVREGGGLTISFNGNRYAMEHAEIVCLSAHAIVTAVLADVFSEGGKEAVLALASNWGYRALEQSEAKRELIQEMIRIYPEDLPRVEVLRQENRAQLIAESETFRKQVRGEEVGRLG